jgi:hypothetical protein
MSPRDVSGQYAVKNCGKACTEWNYNTAGGEWKNSETQDV